MVVIVTFTNTFTFFQLETLDSDGIKPLAGVFDHILS